MWSHADIHDIPHSVSPIRNRDPSLRRSSIRLGAELAAVLVLSHDDVQQRSQNYAFMLHNLMVMIQEYLLLSDDNKQRGEHRICIWLEDVWSER